MISTFVLSFHTLSSCRPKFRLSRRICSCDFDSHRLYLFKGMIRPSENLSAFARASARQLVLNFLMFLPTAVGSGTLRSRLGQLVLIARPGQSLPSFLIIQIAAGCAGG